MFSRESWAALFNPNEYRVPKSLVVGAWEHKLKENTKWFNCYISGNVNWLWLLSVFHWECHVVLKYFMWYWIELNWSGWQLPVCHILETDFRSSVFAGDANSFLLDPSSFGTWQKTIWIIWRQLCSCITLGLLGRLIAISGLLSWRKRLDLECLSSFLGAICQVSHAMRVEEGVWRPRFSSEQQLRLKSVLPFHPISDPFCHGKEIEERADGWTEFWKKSLKVYSGTRSCNCLNTSDYTSNHSNSWWNISAATSLALQGFCTGKGNIRSNLWATHYPRAVSLVGLVKTPRCKKKDITSFAVKMVSMMCTQARTMFCASTYLGMLAPSSQCVNWLI